MDHHAPPHRTITGTVTSFNIGPKGGREGMILAAAGPEGGGGDVQVNFPAESVARIAAEVAVGERVTVVAAPEQPPAHGAAAHPVLRLVALESARSGRLECAAPARPAPQRVRGTVRTLNYARHGEPNGALLEDGTFVHLKPHGAVEAALAVGMDLEVGGPGWRMADGALLVDAVEVNGTALAHGPRRAREPRRG